MENSKILSSLAKDILYLYCSTNERSLENVFLRLSENFETTLSDWLKSDLKMADLRKRMSNSDILDAILLLQKIKTENPSGINKTNLVTKYFISNSFSSKNKKTDISTPNDNYVHIIKGFGALLSDPDVSNILSPFANIIELFDVFTITNADNPTALVGDLRTISSGFKSYRDGLVNDPFEDDTPLKPQKLNKKQKKNGLLNYLTFKFGEEVSVAFDKINRQDISSKIRTGEGDAATNSLLLNPKAIYGLFPNMVGNPSALEANARIVVKESLKDFEPATYEKTYNEIRNSIFFSSGVITYKQHQDFKYNQLVNRGKSDATEIESIGVDTIKWIYPSPAPIQLLSLILFSMNARINMQG